MKRLILASCFLAILTVIPSYGFDVDGVSASTVYTADQNAVVTGAGYFFGILAATDGVNALTVAIYDNTAASGSKLIPDVVVTTSATDRFRHIKFNPPVRFNSGLTVDITLAAGAASYVIYTEERK